MHIMVQSVPVLEASPRTPCVEEQRLLLHNVSWQSYVAIGEALRDRSNLRMTYDRGNLEFMTLSPEHEQFKSIFRLLIQTLAEEMAVPIKSYGSTTYRGAEVERGIEPDESFYTQQLARMRGIRRIDLKRDPPPDLVLEVDITHSAKNRLDIYAKIGVPEVWCFDGEALRVYHLVGGVHEECERSPTFPTIPLQELLRFVLLSETEDDGAVLRAFRAWVREQLGQTRE